MLQEFTDLSSARLDGSDDKADFDCTGGFGSSMLRSNGTSVDQQLHEWGQAFWIQHENADPFHVDWLLWQEQVDEVWQNTFGTGHHGCWER
jgi:hypothetical protein